MRFPRGLALVLAEGISPVMARWAEVQEKRVLREGEPLGEEMLDFANGLGIHEAENVRVMEVERIPLPVPRWLLGAARRMRLPVFEPCGMALGRGIYLLPGQQRSLPHELVHVMQYQREGGILPFMKRYVRECLEFGYANAALEVEADRESRCEWKRNKRS